MKTLLLIAVWFLSHFAHLIASTWMLIGALFGRDRAWAIALGYDHLGNAATGGNPNETISSRAYKAMQDGRRWGCILCRLLDYLQKDHCKKSATP
jgi:hypothetical protein